MPVLCATSSVKICPSSMKIFFNDIFRKSVAMIFEKVYTELLGIAFQVVIPFEGNYMLSVNF